MVITVPTSITLMSSQLMNIYKKKVFYFFRVPKKIISDQGPQFASKFTHDICYILGIEQNLLTAYHPKMNTQVKWMNHEVVQYLCMYVSYHQEDWSEWLPLAQFAPNDKISTSTSQSPFYLNHGCHPHLLHICNICVTKEVAAQFDEWLRWMRKWRRLWNECYRCQMNCSIRAYNQLSVCHGGGPGLYQEYKCKDYLTIKQAHPTLLWPIWGHTTG